MSTTTQLQELYLDQNENLDLGTLPPELALLPGLRKLYVSQEQKQPGAAVAGGPGGGGNVPAMKGSLPYQ